MTEGLQEEDVAEIQSAASMLGEFLTRDSSLEQHIQEIIDRKLSEEPGVDTFGAVGRGLAEYMGNSAAALLMRFLAEEDAEPLLEAVRELGELEKREELLLFLPRLRALYGETVWMAYAIWQENPDDWRMVDREVYYDQVAEQWALRLTITKYNGEAMAIRGSASSFLSLATSLLEMLNRVPDPGAIDPARLEEFSGELKAFEETFLAEKEEEPTS